jgi:hypothetical protein
MVWQGCTTKGPQLFWCSCAWMVAHTTPPHLQQALIQSSSHRRLLGECPAQHTRQLLQQADAARAARQGRHLAEGRLWQQMQANWLLSLAALKCLVVAAAVGIILVVIWPQQWDLK